MLWPVTLWRARAAQPHHRVCDLAGLDQSALRIGRNQGCERFGLTASCLADNVGNRALDNIRIHITRTHGIHRDVAGRIFQCQCTSQADDRMLRADIGGNIRGSAQARDTGDVDDAAKAGLQHVGNGLSAAQVGAVEVDGKQLVPQLFVRVQ